MTTVTVGLTLDLACVVEFEWQNAGPDVGIMTPGPAIESVRYGDVELLPLLTENEVDYVVAQIIEQREEARDEYQREQYRDRDL